MSDREPPTLTGRAFAHLILSLPVDEQLESAADLLEVYDGPLCRDCGGRHLTVYSALACDDLTDARQRKRASQAARAIHRSARQGVITDG